MYPNPQDVLPLPPRPDLHQYRKRAKELAKVCGGGEAAIRSWAARWARDLLELQPTLDEAQLARSVERSANQVATFAVERLVAAGCALAQALFVIARAHGFKSGPGLVHHLDARGAAHTPVSAFEGAADAIIAGDRTTLEQLLRDNPRLVHDRSGRQHRATLLHYVAANGVENYRQKTPPNIVEIAQLLLDAGAKVDAEADVYGGGATTLALTTTSAHPRAAGVQHALAELLLERGARIGPESVRHCLMNGCPEAAEHLARHGAPVGLVEAAGLGRVDLVERHVDERRSFGDHEWRQEVGEALMMAVWYDRVDVVTRLLDRGFDPGWKIRDGDANRTALHLASHEGRVAIVGLLLRRAAPVDVADDVHGTTPLLWALHAWLVEGRRDQDSYRVVVRMLVDAGAEVRAEWIDDDRVRTDLELFATLIRRAEETKRARDG
jgi:ankyrin repeat protein